MLKVSWSLIIKQKLTAQLNLSIIMHKASVSTKRLIKRSAIDVNRQKVRDNIDWSKHCRFRRNVNDPRNENSVLSLVSGWL